MRGTESGHGFGVSLQQMRVDELVRAGNRKGYECTANGSNVRLTCNSGITVTVQVEADKYLVQGTKKLLSFKSIDTVMKAISKTADKLLDKRNKQYE